jgi:hypothetical protein
MDFCNKGVMPLMFQAQRRSVLVAGGGGGSDGRGKVTAGVDEGAILRRFVGGGLMSSGILWGDGMRVSRVEGFWWCLGRAFD